MTRKEDTSFLRLSQIGYCHAGYVIGSSEVKIIVKRNELRGSLRADYGHRPSITLCSTVHRLHTILSLAWHPVRVSRILIRRMCVTCAPTPPYLLFKRRLRDMNKKIVSEVVYERGLPEPWATQGGDLVPSREPHFSLRIALTNSSSQSPTCDAFGSKLFEECAHNWQWSAVGLVDPVLSRAAA